MSLAGMFFLAAAAVAGASPRATARWSCADEKEGYAYYSGDVRIVDDACSICADRAYVFMDGTNETRRVVAYGGVAVESGGMRASGDAASYFRDTGMVVVSAGDGRMAEVRDGQETPPTAVRGRKVRLWTQTKQVEVLESGAEASRPEGGVGAFNGTFGN